MDARRRSILSLVDPAGSRGLEVGALARPIVERGMGEVLYADRLSSADLRRHYAPSVASGDLDLSSLVEVDVVVPDGQSLSASLPPGFVPDYIVASHVMEHAPDPVGWLADLAACLGEGGLICLALPDKRFIFDHLRDTTTVREVVEWSIRRPSRPTPGQVFDHVSRLSQVEAAAVWQGTQPRPSALTDRAMAPAMARSAFGGDHHDVHCSVLTPASFCEVFGEVIALDLLPLEFAAFEPTPVNGTEFFVTFRKRAAATPAERAASTPVLDRAAHHALPVAALEPGPRKRFWQRRNSTRHSAGP